MYLYNVPCCALYDGATHSCLRRLSSSACTCRSIVFLTASTEIVSPSRTSAIGPPSCASGTTWPITNPWELQEDRNRQKALSGTGHVLGVGRRLAHPPLNLPSVTQATSWPRPAPIIRLVGLSISGMPDSTICPFNCSQESKMSRKTHRGRPSVRDTSER
jgi:hypothetical protein